MALGALHATYITDIKYAFSFVFLRRPNKDILQQY